MVIDFDDWSEEHDCRDRLEKLKEINPFFKVTLFTIPAKTNIEMLAWADQNDYWVELVQHGWAHEDNHECSRWDYEDASMYLHKAAPYFKVRGFKAPGWQISDDTLKALRDYGFWVADQDYNDDRAPEGLKRYVLGRHGDHYHGHTWDCGCDNGIYEDWDNIKHIVKINNNFKFVSEVV